MRTKQIIFLLLLIVFLPSSICFAIGEAVPEENKGIRPQGAPVVKYSSDFGLSMGAHISIYDYDNAEQKPFRYLYRLQGMFGTNGDYSTSLFFDAPHFLNTKFRFQASAGMNKVNNYNYFGIGNDTPDVTSSAYYTFERTTPYFLFNIIHNFHKDLYAIAGYSFDKRIISASASSKLKSDSPLGADGGIDSEIRFGIAYDTRDNEAMPTRGNYSDLFAEFPQKWIGSTFNYARLTLSERNYLTIFPNIVWANRITLKNSIGDVPFYEKSSIGGLNHFDGLGGNSTLRGFRQSRFLDRSVILFNEELRFHVSHFYVKSERFDIHLLTFADFGRVFNSMKNFSLNDMHLSNGGGARLSWNRNFVIAPDVGFSKEGYSVYLSFKNIF